MDIMSEEEEYGEEEFSGETETVEAEAPPELEEEESFTEFDFEETEEIEEEPEEDTEEQDLRSSNESVTSFLHKSGGSGTDEDRDLADITPNPSLLVELAEEDAREFEVDDSEMDEFLPKSKFKDKSYEKLREFYEHIIADLERANRVGIPMDEVKEEFNFVWDAIQKSHDNLEGLLHKDLRLSVEVADTMAKTRNLIRIAEDNPEKAVQLAKRLQTAWNLVDISRAEEKRNADRLDILEQQVIDLNRKITQAQNMEGRLELNELIKTRKKLAEERDTLRKEMIQMRTTLTLLQERKLRQADKKVEFHDQIKYADEETIALSEALSRETTRKHRIEKAIKDTIEEVGIKTEELTVMEKQMSEASSTITHLEHTLRDQKVVNDVAAREAESAMSKQEKLQAEVDTQVQLVERLAAEAYRRQAELKAREEEIQMIKLEGARSERQRISNLKKCEAMQETLEALEQERENLRGKIQALERDLEKAQRRLEESKKEVEELDKQRAVVDRNIQRAQAVLTDHDNQIKINAAAITNLEGELDGYQREIVNQTETIHRLERERDFYSHEATKLAQIISSKVDKIKRLDLSILSIKRRVTDLEDTCKTIQLAFESTVVEKQYNERVLRDVINELLDCAKAFRDVKFEKYTLEYREADLKNLIAVEHDKRDLLDKETEFFKTEANRMNHLAVDLQRETEALESERTTLAAAVASGENEIAKQRYYATGALSRKLNYQRKLMKKETELRETWDKWRTLHSMVRIGAYHYRILMREITEIRKSIVGLRQEQMHFKGNVNHIESLRQEISSLESCIAKETCMVNALEEQLKTPINIHRWRVLESIDPEAYNLVKKVGIVTKRLVNHNEQIRLQNLRITDQEQIYVDIKTVMRQLPGLETPEERLYLEVLYEAKKQQLEVLKHEMYASEAQTSFFRGQVVQLSQRMEQLKKEYFAKKEAELRAKSSMQMQKSNSNINE